MSTEYLLVAVILILLLGVYYLSKIVDALGEMRQRTEQTNRLLKTLVDHTGPAPLQHTKDL